MSAPTNKLVLATKKIAAPAATALSLVLCAGFLMQHNNVHAASMAPGSRLDDNSVAPLVSLDQAVENVAAQVTPAVVNVAVTSRNPEHAASQAGEDRDLPPGFAQFFGPMMPGGRQGQSQQQPLEHGVGSGIIISPNGYIVTNNHVVEGAVQMQVTLNDRRVLNAKLVGADKLTDLAVIKVDASNLTSIPWGDSGKLKPGQTVLAFGSPFGYFQFSVTRGIVSAVNRPNPYSDDPRKPGGFIQTDAAINPGNSGGALVNSHGELVGINTFIISKSGSFEGAGFAIPAQIAQATAEQLIKHGKVDHGYLGISMNDVTPDNARFFDLDEASGTIVAQVSPDSPASRAGLRGGDVITAVNGQRILNGSALQVAITSQAPGTRISLGILRGGKAQAVDLTVGEYNKESEVAGNDGTPGAPASGKLGLAVSDLDSNARQQLELPGQLQGVAVQSVRPASPAEDAGITPGDVILEVDRHPIGSAGQFVNEVHANGAGKNLLLLVWSKGNASYRLVRPDSGNASGM